MTSTRPAPREVRRTQGYAAGAFGARTPYLLLGTIFVVGGVLDWFFDITVVRDPLEHSTDLVAGVALVCVGVLLMWLGPRTSNGWALDLALGFGYVLSIMAGLRVVDAVGIVALGFSMVVYGIFAAVFRPTRRLALHLALVVVLFAAVAQSRELVDSELIAYICLFIVAVSSLVAVLAGRLRRMALHDGLTGALNRHGLDVMSELVAATAARSDSPVTLCLLDVDRFKEFNDRAGHVAGDSVLVELVDAWSAHVRATDLVARYGGDEFAVLLPGATEQDALDLVDRVRADVEIAFSIGVTTWLPAEDLHAALRRADERLRAAQVGEG